MSKTIKRISILGCGWLGFPLAVALLEDGYEVLGSTTTEEKLERLAEAGIQPYLIKVGSEITGQIDDFFRTDLLVINIPPGRKRADVMERYPQEIKTLLERALAGQIRRVLFISSTGVYQDVNREVTEAETALTNRGSGGALVICETYLRTLSGVETTIVRPAGLVGGDRKAGRFLAGKQNVSNGDAPINMVHRADCIAVIRQLIAQEVWGEIFNLCADEHPSRRAFYTYQAKKHGFEPPDFAETNDPPRFKIVSNQKLKDELNYTFLYPDPMQFP